VKKVLLAEDEPALLELFSEVLRGMGLECVAASDGATAIALAQEHRPHLVVTDYMMPERSGAEVMRAVQEHPALEHVPVILMSAGRPPRSEQQQAWRFLAKPVDVATFEGAVREALAASAHEPRRGVELLERTMSQLRRIDQLVNGLLDSAQRHDGELELARRPVDLVELVEAAAAFWRDTHPDGVFEVEVPPHAVEVDGDGERLRQIVDNLASNAVKYGRSTPIILQVAQCPQTALVRVIDHGRGIAAEAIPQLFDRFQGVPGEGGRGNGLGLFIAAALARAHGGIVSVESEVGRGSTFSIELPLMLAT